MLLVNRYSFSVRRKLQVTSNHLKVTSKQA